MYTANNMDAKSKPPFAAASVKVISIIASPFMRESPQRDEHFLLLLRLQMQYDYV